MKKTTTLLCVFTLLLVQIPSVVRAEPLGTVFTYTTPIDAVSLGVERVHINLQVSGFVDGEWTTPQVLEVETEFDPTLRETNLVLFPKAASAIRITGTDSYQVHPIRVSTAPAHYETAAIGSTSRPRIYSRNNWGADDTFLFQGTTTSRSDEVVRVPLATPAVPSTPSKRQTDCQDDQSAYAADFAVEQTVSSFGGQKLRWARRYSPKVRQLVVHHTAMEAQHDGRTGVEKMRALYEYHANNRGWGDVGYNYIIDDEGQIYEGRSGGDYVVGGHAYCNNVGTIGVAMMGNFESEKPTEKQLTSLKWLLDNLSEKYDIQPGATIERRGKRMPTIVGHGDLVSTICPGFYVTNTLSQIRKQVVAKDFNGRIIFPTVTVRTYANASDSRLKQRLQDREISVQNTTLQALGDTKFTSRPGATIRTSVQFNAQKLYSGSERIATVERSNSRIGIWQEANSQSVRVRQELLLTERLQPGASVRIPLRFQMPREPGTYSVDIGKITYTFVSEGRRISQPKTGSTYQAFSAEDRVNTQTTGYRRQRAYTLRAASTAVAKQSKVNMPVTTSQKNIIRIRLSSTQDTVNISANSLRYTLQKNGNSCELLQNNRVVDSGVIRLQDAKSNLVTISNWPTVFNTFRGILECRVIENQLALINELPLEDYMAGLGEEPDTELYEKQKAFAVAARSYAAFYIQATGDKRKFIGMPYDGSDSPASFQLYKGYVFEQKNPRWAQAVRATVTEVLQKNGGIVKAAYYSSNDGRTRSPAENGWQNFPYAEVFTSKPDPWCKGLQLRGHGVGMSGCGALGQAKEGKSYLDILAYYYAGTEVVEYK